MNTKVQNDPPPGTPERRQGPEDRRQPSNLESILVKALAAFIVVGITCAAAIFGFGLVLKEIQQQRFDSLVQTCEETNKRNKNVNSEIDKAIEALPARKQAKAEKDAGPFRLILNASVPYTDDCHEYANERVKGYF